MKQILIEKTDTIIMQAGTKFFLSVTSKILPTLTAPAGKVTIIDFPLNLKVLSGGEDYTLMMNLFGLIGEYGIAMISSEKRKTSIRVVLANLTQEDVSFEEGIPLVEVSFVQAVAFRQIESTVTSPNGTEASFENDVMVIKPKTEERKADAQVRKARKSKKETPKDDK